MLHAVNTLPYIFHSVALCGPLLASIKELPIFRSAATLRQLSFHLGPSTHSSDACNDRVMDTVTQSLPGFLYYTSSFTGNGSK